MSTKQRRFAERVFAFGGVALAGLALWGARASSSSHALEREFQATYPRSPAPFGLLAGVALDKLAVPGLRLVARENHTPEDGGVVLSYGDPNGEVRAVIKVAVARDAAEARRFVDVELHGVQVTLPRAVDAAFGDQAFADDEGRGEALVIGAAANLAWVVHVDRDRAPAPRAGEVVKALRALVVEGAPTFPAPTIALPATLPLTGARFSVSAGPLTPALRAEGAYVAHGKSAPLLKPFGAGPVAVVATAVDELGRVGEARAEGVAR